MKLNTTSYVHKKIRQLCYQLEILSGMHIVTDLGEEFNQVRFVDKYGYIIIDYQNNACFTLSHSMSKNEWDTVRDIMKDLQWLDIPNTMGTLARQKKHSKK